MKKHILVLASLFTLLFSSVQAEVGINVGATGSMGLFGASAFENEDGEVSREDDAMLAVGFASVFLEKTLDRLSEKIEKTLGVVNYLNQNNINPKKINKRLNELKETEIEEPTRMANILKRPRILIADLGVKVSELKNNLSKHMKNEILFEAETIIKYSGYINRQKEEIDKIKIYEDMIIPENFDYNKIKSLSNESREKFISIKPQTVGQAQRINGIRPSDISILLVYLKRPFHVKQKK